MGKFSTLFEVRFYQRFYDAYTLRDLEVVPSPETATTLKGLQLLYRTTPESLVVLFNEEKRALLERLREPIPLSFGLSSSNRHFETFSRIRPFNKRTRYFIDNRQVGEDGRLHAGEWLEETDAGSFFSAFSDPRTLTDDPVSTISQAERTVLDGPPGVSFRWSTDDAMGWYDLRSAGNAEPARMYRLPDSFRQMFAVVDLWFGGAGPMAFPQLAGNRYQVRIDHRAVYWHYYFVSEKGVLPRQAEIFMGKERMPFSEPERIQLVNGQWALRLTSLSAYPLRAKNEDWSVTAHLSDFQDEGLKAMPRTMALPVADATRIKGKSTDIGEIYFWESYNYI